MTRSSVVPGAADAEQDQRRSHSGSVTTTSARAARPPTVTYSVYEPASSGARSTSTSRLPAPRRPSKNQRYDSGVRQHAHREALARAHLDALTGELDEAHAHGDGARPDGAVPGAIDRTQPDLVEARPNDPAVDAAEPDEVAFEPAELALHALAAVDEHHGARSLVDPVRRRHAIAAPVGVRREHAREDADEPDRRSGRVHANRVREDDRAAVALELDARPVHALRRRRGRGCRARPTCTRRVPPARAGSARACGSSDRRDSGCRGSRSPGAAARSR